MFARASAAGPAPDGDAALSRPAGRAGAKPGRILVTVLGTLLVVGLEFGLLHAVYNRATPTREQLQIAARLDGAVAVVASTPSPSPSALTALRRTTASALDDLAAADVPAGQLRPLRAALAGLGPSTTASLARAADRLRAGLADSAHGYDQQADLIYVGLLVTVSLGWMVWFRRLVGRHRALQAAVTEQQSLALGEQRLAALVRNASDVVLVCDLDGGITFATPSARAVLGYPAEELVGRVGSDLLPAEDRPAFLATLATVEDGADLAVATRMTHADGRVLHVEGNVTNLVGDPAVGGLVITLRDVTSRVSLEAELTHQAFHDSLTGLANRQLFTDRLDHALLARTDTTRRHVVLFCDLDEFKNVNDSLGHGAGDIVLSQVARRAAACLRPGDTAARFGGDEFAFLLEDAGPDDAAGVAHRIQDAVRAPITVEGRAIVIEASVGLAAAVAGRLTAEEVLRNADVAMYRAKGQGSGTVAVYDEHLHAQALERLAVRADLQQAIRDDQITVQYQPTVDLGTGTITGFEALARWIHPTRGFVSPVEFIPIAEQTGLIHPLGLSVLRHACTTAIAFTAAAGRPVRVAVNVTAQQLSRTDFVDEVTTVLAESGLPARQLVLEITESALLHGVELVRDRLAALRAAGVRVAVDDFGTGYSSLSYLRDLPLDILKIDKAFVDHVVSSPTDATLTQAIVTMSRSMQLTTVAEGVEDQEQAAWLRAVGCELGQGYLWSRPVPVDDALALLAAPLDDAGPALAA